MNRRGKETIREGSFSIAGGIISEKEVRLRGKYTRRSFIGTSSSFTIDGSLVGISRQRGGREERVKKM